MRHVPLFLIACMLAAIVPWVASTSVSKPDSPAFPGWPVSFEERALTAIPLSERDKGFMRGFPGRMASFFDGTHTILFRWVTRETRTLHSASDCFRGSGYSVYPLPLHRDANSRLWNSFRAVRGAEILSVREGISDEFGTSWTDVSAWYWDALRGATKGPWWAVTVVMVGGPL